MQRRICAQQAQCIPAATSACCCVEQSSRASPKRGTVLEPASPACQVRSRHRLGSSDRAPAPIGLPCVRTLRDSGLTWLIHALLLLLLLGCVDAVRGSQGACTQAAARALASSVAPLLEPAWEYRTKSKCVADRAARRWCVRAASHRPSPTDRRP